MNEDASRIRTSIGLTAAWLLVLWAIALLQLLLHSNWSHLGLVPRSIEGLPGILTMPFLHAQFTSPWMQSHLVSNSIALAPLAAMLFYIYRPLALRVLLAVWLGGGLITWAAARDAVHIGASGVIYGLAFFMLFSGIFRRDRVSVIVTMLVVFINGSMVWGIFPGFSPAQVSWEAHLFGALTGTAAAFILRKEHPLVTPRYDWETAPDQPEPGPWDYRKHYPPPEGFSHPPERTNEP